MELSVVIPVYNSSTTIHQLVARLIHVLDRLQRDYQIILVDDGSNDNSWEALCKLHEQHPDQLVIMQLMRNFGQHNALMCGFRHSKGGYIVTIDDDLQNPPEEIPKLVQELERNDLDVVYGASETKKHSRWRNLGTASIRFFYRTIFRMPVTTTSFRIINRKALESIFPYRLNYTYIDGLLAWSTQRIGTVQVDHQPRVKGDSGYSIGKLLVLAFNLFTNFSLLPLQLVSLTGMFTALLGLATGLYYFIQFLTSNIVIPGYASTIVAILVLGGVQLLALGIMGEYLGRVHMNINQKPQYVIRDARGNSHSLSGPDKQNELMLG